MTPVFWTEDAEQDLQECFLAAREQDLTLARNIEERLIKTLRTIEQYPKSADFVAARKHYEKTIPNTRLVLIYRIENGSVVIHAVCHTSRSPQKKGGRAQ